LICITYNVLSYRVSLDGGAPLSVVVTPLSVVEGENKVKQGTGVVIWFSVFLVGVYY
jgi:hypothetical protein